MEEYYQFLRLQHLSLEGSSLYLGVMDDFLRKANFRFFPGTIFSFFEIKKEIEKDYPINISYRYVPWRSCSLRVEPLEVFLQIYWDHVLWNVSREGRAWEFSQEDTDRLLSSIPRIIWGEGLNSPVALSQSSSEKRRVCNVLAPLDRIEGYIHALSEGDFFRKIPAFTVQKKGIRFQVLLEFEAITIILDGEKPEYWPQIDRAVKALLQKLGTSQKMCLDATYPDKIIVQELY